MNQILLIAVIVPNLPPQGVVEVLNPDGSQTYDGKSTFVLLVVHLISKRNSCLGSDEDFDISGHYGELPHENKLTSLIMFFY